MSVVCLSGVLLRNHHFSTNASSLKFKMAYAFTAFELAPEF